MPPRKSPSPSPVATATADLDARITKLAASVDKMIEETEAGIESILETQERLIEEVRILRIAIDDARAEMEWTMKNHAPKRSLPTHTPLKSLPKPDPRIEPDRQPVVQCERCDAADPGSVENAEEAGWTRIYEYDGPGSSYVGTCGDCQRAIDKEEGASKTDEQDATKTQGSLFS